MCVGTGGSSLFRFQRDKSSAISILLTCFIHTERVPGWYRRQHRHDGADGAARHAGVRRLRLHLHRHHGHGPNRRSACAVLRDNLHGGQNQVTLS